MNVLVVSDAGEEKVANYVETLCHFLVGEKVGVHFAYFDTSGNERLRQLVAFIATHGGETLNLRLPNQAAWVDLQAVKELRAMAQRVKPDVIHSHRPKSGLLARALCFAGIDSAQVYQPHDYRGMSANPGRFAALGNAAERCLGRMAYTVTASLAERRFAVEKLHIPEDRIFEARYGVDTDKFKPMDGTEKRQLRAELGLPLDAKILGFFGGSTEQQDPRTVYRAFAKAAAFDRDITLFHVGQGQMDETLRNLTAGLGIRTRVFRTPQMSSPAQFYQAIDGYIRASTEGGFATSTIEALASDLPMILSDTPGHHDAIALPLSHSWKAIPGDILGFARTISSWSFTLDQSLPINHREVAIAKFQRSKQMAAVLGIYQGLTASAPVIGELQATAA